MIGVWKTAVHGEWPARTDPQQLSISTLWLISLRVKGVALQVPESRVTRKHRNAPRQIPGTENASWVRAHAIMQ